MAARLPFVDDDPAFLNALPEALAHRVSDCVIKTVDSAEVALLLLKPTGSEPGQFPIF